MLENQLSLVFNCEIDGDAISPVNGDHPMVFSNIVHQIVSETIMVCLPDGTQYRKILSDNSLPESNFPRWEKTLPDKTIESEFEVPELVEALAKLGEAKDIVAKMMESD